MKCTVGDRAKVVQCLNENNLGKEVIVTEYIGFLKKGETFSFRGIQCGALITDHYWWVDSTENSLANQYGPSPRAYLPDTWLEPVISTLQCETEDAVA